MALDAGSVFTILGAKFNPAGHAQFDAANKKAVASATAAESRIAASQKRTGAGFAAVGTAATVGGAAIVVGLAKSLVVAARFEKQMSELSAVTKAGAREMGVMKQAALDLGAKTGVGATQAARALTELAKGGMSAKQSTDALVGTIALAQAGNMDLADAAGTVVQSLSTFNLKAGDASRVADGLASAANKTTMDVGDFAQAFAMGGSAAQAAGLSFDQTLNVLGAMANRFKSGSDMGTSLKTTLQQLASPTKKAQAEMDRLNIDLFDSKGKFRDAATVTHQLAAAFDELTPKQRLAAATMIAGSDGARTLINLAQGAAGAVREIGAAGDAASEKMDNLAGDWKKLKAEAQGIGIAVGEKMIPALRDGAKELRTFLQDMKNEEPGSAGGAFKQLTDLARDGSDISWDFLKRGAEATQYLLDAISNYHPPDVEITAKVADEASPVLARLKDAKLAPKVQKILADDSSPREKYEALRRLKIPDIVARLILQEQGVDAAIAALHRIPHTVPVTARLRDEASQILTNIINKPLRDKVARIIADDDDVQSKIRRLMALGISGPTANFLANTVSVTEATARLRGQRITVPVQYVPQVMRPSLPGGMPTPGDKSAGARKASGRAPGDRETALVGEGAGPEWVGNEKRGWQRVDRPTLTGLAPDDYVIPTERRYSGRALDLLASAFGIEGYAKGKKASASAKKPPKKKRAPRPIPAKVYAEHSVDYYQGEVSDLEQRASDRDKKNKLTRRAKDARKALPKARAELKAARAYKAQIEKATSEADIQADLMRAADTKDNQRDYDAAYKRRRKQIQQARALLRKALKLNPRANAWTQSIRAQLARLGSDLADLPPTPGSILDEPDAQTTYTKAEEARLDEIDSRIALAALTPDKQDDLTAQRDKEAFLAPLLSVVQASSGAGRGGFDAITQIAGELRSTRDQITDLTRAPELTADQQASAEQSYQRGLAEGRGASIDRLVNATLAGAGAGPSIVFQSYVPPSPAEARRLADYTVGGISFQGARPASVERIGA